MGTVSSVMPSTVSCPPGSRSLARTPSPEFALMLPAPCLSLPFRVTHQHLLFSSRQDVLDGSHLRGG